MILNFPFRFTFVVPISFSVISINLYDLVLSTHLDMEQIVSIVVPKNFQVLCCPNKLNCFPLIHSRSIQTSLFCHTY